MLGKEVSQGYGDRVRFVTENFGESKLADRFGIKRYPAVFINDVLVAKPKDFGFYGKEGSQGEGRYVPWQDASNHEKFKRDLTRMIDLALRGEADQLRAEGIQKEDGANGEIAAIPLFTLTDLDGKPLASEEIADRVVVVEFWASWCPPCRSTLDWLGEMSREHADDVAVLAIAVESPEQDVARQASEHASNVRYAIGTPEVAAAFGDIVAVPTMFVFARDGSTAGVFYGAPDGLHRQVAEIVSSLLGK